ncbi:MFS transporter [Streptomyces inusitatus]|uniref:MFS transporter n=1 Tax=Streptomyces inusitatus TaxID=68221 RepID=A0A918V034_9ACTN|nr:MFS transporter [Streptomyces inusitatus]GGZ48886.1 MFS transporter [Streptomyces inusitatus]
MPPAENLRAGRREWLALVVLALPALLLALDSGVLQLALPAIGADLRTGPAQLLWAMDVYGFMIAGFLVTMGSLGDRIGRRRLLMAGAAAFGGASVLVAYADSATALIAARALLGIAGAALMPTTLALISTLFRDPRQRTAAVGVWMTCFMAGMVIGPLVGGVLLRFAWWGSVFLLGVPVMALLLITAPFLLPADRDRTPDSAGLDPLSVLLSLAAVLATVQGLKGLAVGAGTALSSALVVLGVLLGRMFVRRQRGLPRPLLDLGLFADRTIRSVLLIMLLGGAAMGGIGLLTAQYLQLALGLDPLSAGLWMLPYALAMLIGSALTPPLARRIPPGRLIAGGLGLAAAGYGLLLTQAASGGLPAVITGLVVVYLGLAPSAVLGTDLILAAAPAGRTGSASALSESGSELGFALGTAVLGSVATAVYRVRMPETARTDETFAGAVSRSEELPAGPGRALFDQAREAFTDGLTAVAWVCALLAAVLAALALKGIRGPAPAD